MVISSYRAHQWWHVPCVHLATGDLLLGLRHGTHLEALWTSCTWTHDDRQSHRACLHPLHFIKLLLQHCRSVSNAQKVFVKDSKCTTPVSQVIQFAEVL